MAEQKLYRGNKETMTGKSDKGQREELCTSSLIQAISGPGSWGDGQ
jgi:hypothetical protein